MIKNEQEVAQILRERASRISKPLEDAPGDISRIVVFRLGKEVYGLEITNVVEIFRAELMTPVPGAPIYVEGVTNLRGDIVTIIDLRAKLTGEQYEGVVEEGRVLVGAIGRETIGLLVDELIGISEVRAGAIDPPLDTLKKLQADYLVGEFKMDSEIVGLLNLTSILEM